MQVEQGERFLMSKEEALDKIATFTGGRAAEQLIFHSITTGASNDIEQATKLARAMITRYGMSDRFGMVAMETVSNQYLGGDTALACSPETARIIDDEVVKLVRGQYEKAPLHSERARGKAPRAGGLPAGAGDHHRRRIYGYFRAVDSLAETADGGLESGSERRFNSLFDCNLRGDMVC